ncbi:MAG: phospholipase [Chitinivibrionales bacterium]|nr:phospholipase [Chitinivibrionales bacterium]
MEFITNTEIYDRVVTGKIPEARSFVWIATADIKDLYVAKGTTMVPFLEILSDHAGNGVSLRLMHAKEPGPAFRKDFDRYPKLIEGLERILCPRIHFKCVVVDGEFAYSGSANLTGAGMGAKSENRRNFESGFITSNKDLVSQIMEQYDTVWMGAHCATCQRKKYCADFSDIM